MKRNWRNNIAISMLMLGLFLAFSACDNKGEKASDGEQADTYTCPMHPTVVSDKPGTCPICGMDLVRKARSGEEIEITEDLARLIKSPNEIIVASIKTIKGEYKKMPVTIEAPGIVTYDTRNIYTIPARFGGRLEKVYLKYPFQKVSKGQKVADIYSPELLTAQRELLFLIENDPGNEALIQGAKEKLSLLGATQAQIADLIARKEVQSTFTIYSPYNGYIITNDQQAPVAPAATTQSTQGSAMGDDMGGGMSTPSSGASMNSTPANAAEGAIIREGGYVTSGQTLFKVVNTSALRIELNVPSSRAGAIHKGSKVELDFGNETMETAEVDFIQPFYNEGKEFVTIRVYTKAIESLQIGHLVKAVVKGDSTEALWIPKEALLDLGLDKIVFIKDREVLKPKKVVVGTSAKSLVEIKQGLSSSDEIAVNAQFLVDSESFIKTQK